MEFKKLLVKTLTATFTCYCVRGLTLSVWPLPLEPSQCHWRPAPQRTTPRRIMTPRTTGLAKSCIDRRSTLIKMGTRKKLCAAYDDLDHCASIQFHSVACLHVYGRFLESFLVAQYDPLVRFDLACRSDARYSDNWPALHHGLICVITDTSLWQDLNRNKPRTTIYIFKEHSVHIFVAHSSINEHLYLNPAQSEFKSGT